MPKAIPFSVKAGARMIENAPSAADPDSQAAKRRALRDAVATYEPFNEQEAADKPVILHALDTDSNCFDRSAQAHMACSIWVVDPTATQTLLVYHRIYDSWSWIGGHADGEADLAAVALRELEEETGVAHAQLVPCGPGGIYSLEVLTVNGHEKRGRYVSSHLHLNVTYLAVADPAEPIRAKPDENKGVRWAPLEDAVRLSTEPWIRTRIYRKLIDKLERRPGTLFESERKGQASLARSSTRPVPLPKSDAVPDPCSRITSR